MHRHQYNGRKLSRKAGPRKALLRNLAASVILYERVRTTLPKAKEIQPIVEKLITLAKKSDLASKRALESYLYTPNTAKKLIEEIAPLYTDRKGGYTRIIKLGNRPGDNAPVAIIELLDIDKLVHATSKKSVADVSKNEKPKTKSTVKKESASKTVAKAGK
jgi:large subunit ribosomal protein L17